MKLGLLAFVLLLNSCGVRSATTSTPPPQNSPQTTVALTNKTIADADVAAVKTVIALRDSGKLSQANTNTIENWLALVARTDKAVGLILAKPEAWDLQKKEIYALLLTVAAPEVGGAIDPGAQSVITQILTLISQLKTQVGP